MRHSLKALSVGVSLLFLALASDVIGTAYQVIGVVIFSFILAVGGAFVAARGMMEFLGESL